MFCDSGCIQPPGTKSSVRYRVEQYQPHSGCFLLQPSVKFVKGTKRMKFSIESFMAPKKKILKTFPSNGAILRPNNKTERSFRLLTHR